MSNNVSFFAINADDVTRARKFYEAVFDWQFEPWGPPNFYLIQTAKEGETAIRGGLQERHERVPKQKTVGFECTIAVADVDRAIRAIEANGGRMLSPKAHIPTVGSVAYFLDTEGNIAAVIQPVPHA